MTSRVPVWLKFVILLSVQIIVWSLLDLSQYVMLAILPSLILFLPVKFSRVAVMLTAFVAGFFADLLSHGVLGLSIVALLPVALLREQIVRLVFGSDLVQRGEDISYKRQGPAKYLLGISIVSAVFLLIYVWVDSAGTRPFWFNVLRFCSSLVCSTLLSFILVSSTSDR